MPGFATRREGGQFANRRLSIGDGDRAFTTLEKRVVVLSISDSNDLMEGKPKLSQRMFQSRRLVDTRRKHHDGSPVEDDDQFQPSFLDRLEHWDVIRKPGRD